MSDVKMSDVFHLPLTADKCVVCSNPYQLDWLPLESQVDEIECGSEKEAKMVAHAINNHDQLAEENAELREAVKFLVSEGELRDLDKNSKHWKLIDKLLNKQGKQNG